MFLTHTLTQAGGGGGGEGRMMRLNVSQKVCVFIAFVLFTLLHAVAMNQEVFPDFLTRPLSFIIKAVIYDKHVNFFISRLSRSCSFQKHKFHSVPEF